MYLNTLISLYKFWPFLKATKFREGTMKPEEVTKVVHTKITKDFIV